MTIIDRQGLGDLWLPWYVHRSDPRRPFSDIHLTTQDAQQLRVRDLADDERAWAAMSQSDPNAPHLSHTKSIEQYEQRYRDCERVVLIVPAWVVPEGHVVIDGSHRACAIYRLDPPHLDADVLALNAPPGWPDVQPDPRAASVPRAE